MKNEQEKSDNHNGIYIIIVAVVLCACAYSAVRGCGNEPGVNNNSTATVGSRIKDSAGTAASNIADAARGNSNAEKAIQRADDELERSQTTAENSTERINRIELLVKECIDGNRQALDIMQRIEAANTAGKEKGQP